MTFNPDNPNEHQETPMKYDANATRPSMLIPPGIYPAQISSAEERTSKAGNPMLVVEIVAFTDDGKTHQITDYIVTGGEYPQDWKIKHLCESSGMPVNGEISAQELAGRSCRVKVKIDPAKNGYSEQNRISDYVRTQAGDVSAPANARPAAPAPSAPIGGGAGDLDDAPFAPRMFP